MKTNLRELRTARLMSQGELADQVKLHRVTISNVERNGTNNLQTLRKLEKYFGKEAFHVYEDDNDQLQGKVTA